jgi:ABC-2 type transport system permease protein
MPLLAFGVLIMSGIIWPIEAIPNWLRVISYLLPPTYAVDAIRSVMLRGWGLDKIWLDVLVLFMFGVVFLMLATWYLKREREQK